MKISFEKLFSNNKFTMGFSLFFSFLIWCLFSVNNSFRIEGKENTKTISGIKLSMAPLFNDEYKIFYEYSTIPPVFDLVVKSDRVTLEKLSEVDFEVEGKITTPFINPGEFELELTGKKKKSELACEIVTKLNSIKIAIDKQINREFEIESGVSYRIKENFLDEVVKFNPEKIKIKGPKFLVNSIYKVIAIGKIDEELTETYRELICEITLNKANGDKINFKFLEINSKNPQATVPVLKRSFLEIEPQILNGPKMEFLKSIIKINPQKKEILGPGKDIDEMKSIKTSFIDFSNKDIVKNSFKIKLDVPQDCKIEDEEVEIIANIDNLKIKKISSNNFEFKNYENKNVEKPSKPLEFEIIGPKESIDEFDSKNIKIIFDLKNKNNISGETLTVAKIEINSENCWVWGNKYSSYIKIN